MTDWKDMSAEPKQSVPRIGLHLPIAGGLQNALLKAKALGCDTLQIFSRNPRGWKARPLEDEEVEQFKRVRGETGVAPVVIHANYLINLAAADRIIGEKSRASFREEIERALLLGADYLPRPPLPPEPHETGFRWGSYDGRRSIRERLPQ